MTNFLLIIGIIIALVLINYLLCRYEFKEKFKRNPIGHTVSWISYDVKYSGIIVAFSELEFKIAYNKQPKLFGRVGWIKRDKCTLVYFPKKPS